MFFCGIPRHQEFALMCNLPLNWIQRGDATRERKPLSEKFGLKVDDVPIRPSKQSRRRAVSDDEDQVERCEARANKRVKAGECSMDALAAFESLALNDVANVDQMATDLYSTDQCVYTHVVTGECCQNTGLYEDVEQPGCLFCQQHVSVSFELLESVKQTGKQSLIDEHLELMQLDEQLHDAFVANDPTYITDQERRALCRRRFVLASNQGLGMPPFIVEWLRTSRAPDCSERSLSHAQ